MDGKSADHRNSRKEISIMNNRINGLVKNQQRGGSFKQNYTKIKQDNEESDSPLDSRGMSVMKYSVGTIMSQGKQRK